MQCMLVIILITMSELHAEWFSCTHGSPNRHFRTLWIFRIYRILYWFYLLQRGNTGNKSEEIIRSSVLNCKRTAVENKRQERSAFGQKSKGWLGKFLFSLDKKPRNLIKYSFVMHFKCQIWQESNSYLLNNYASSTKPKAIRGRIYMLTSKYVA